MRCGASASACACTRVAGAMVCLFDREFSKLAMDAGTGLIALLFADEAWMRARSLHSHRLYLNAILGLGSGYSIALLLMLTVSQLVSCAILVVPAFYARMGAEVPSLALGITLVGELVLYHGYADGDISLKAAIVSAALFLIGLLRGDARKRGRSLDVPLHGHAVAVEAGIRFCCTKARISLIMPVVCTLLALRALVYHRFWSYTGTSFETKRTCFTTCVAECALVILASSEDRSPKEKLSAKTWEIWSIVQQKASTWLYTRTTAEGGRKKKL